MLNSLRRVAPRLLPLLLLLGLLVLMMSGCKTDTPQNTFDAKGPVAADQRNIFYIAMWPAIVIMTGVLGGVVLICLRYRERDPKALPPKQLHGNTKLELTWTILPAVFLLALGVPMVGMIYHLGRAPHKDDYIVDVVAQRFSWEFDYPEILDSHGQPVFTISDAHVPAGREVVFRLRSRDVIHSFWIPKLGGKMMDGFYTMNTVNFPYLDDASKNIRDWGQAYKLKFNEDPTIMSVYGDLVIDIFADVAKKAGPNLTTETFIATLEKYTRPRDKFGADEIVFSKTKHLGTNRARLSQVQNGKWVQVTDYLSE